MLASYACTSENSRGRLYKETTHQIYNNAFARDRDYLIRSNAFKRMQYKTQVFINHKGDHCRNRLTHSMEVASVARLIASQLNLSEDLAEIISLAHDLGHTPFGHTGEKALDKAMQNYGGFSHNVHSFKIVTHIERQYPGYRGLNLSWETLSGIVKHNGPLEYSNVPEYIQEYNDVYDLDLYNYATLEAQISSLSDDITYLTHDIEDGISEGLITIDEIIHIKFIQNMISNITTNHHDIDEKIIKYELAHQLKIYFINDLIEETRKNIKEFHIQTLSDIYSLNKQIVKFSSTAFRHLKEIKDFLYKNMYFHPRITSINNKCHDVIKGLFEAYSNDYELLPQNIKKYLSKNNSDINLKMSMIADYIAGMTDRFAILQYEILYNTKIDIGLL